MKLDVRAFALTCGILWGLGLCGITWWIMMFEGPAPADARPVVAVLPFDDRTGTGTDPFRGEMLADLLAADLGESRLVRALETERVVEILRGVAGSEREARERVAAAARVDWVVSANLFREADVYVASFSAWRPEESQAASTSRRPSVRTWVVVPLMSTRNSERRPCGSLANTIIRLACWSSSPREKKATAQTPGGRL